MAMKVEVSLFGFGDDRPSQFSSGDKLELTLNGQSNVVDALRLTGLADAHGISVMLNGVLCPPRNWPEKQLTEGDALKVLLAIEGG